MASFLYSCRRCGAQYRLMEPSEEAGYCEECAPIAAEQNAAQEAVAERDRKIGEANEAKRIAADNEKNDAAMREISARATAAAKPVVAPTPPTRSRK